ncbi:shikimate dehydrogenase [Methyloferula stellata]|uniref:shikimate dehydrogenase n=1 Tax=Methyloferula stellata TaxID=876270 RepID=UPI000366167E|nr:shikimate dehydrogenase [Methyloferula stellata]
MSTNPPRACVIGWPVKHSRSPLIHTYWLQQLGIEGSYGRAEVAPADFQNFVSHLAEKGYRGGNVTLPHKEMAYRLATRRTERADSLQAVNTLWIEGGELWGDNTDIIGFLGGLDAEVQGWEKTGDKAVVLGAGGAARAIVQALLLRNIKNILIFNRTLERAEELARLFGSGVTARPWQQLGESLAGVDLLVNTTSLGMAGQPPLDIDLSALPSYAVVDDIVYVPLETPLLAQAHRRGLRTVGGLSMLLHQAVPGFEHWFGQRPEVTPELLALIEADVTSTPK